MKYSRNYDQSVHYGPSDNQVPRRNRENSQNRNSNFLYLLIISAFIVYGIYTLNQKYGDGKELKESAWGNSALTTILKGDVNTTENNTGTLNYDDSPVPETYDTGYPAPSIAPPEENPDVGNRAFNQAPNTTIVVQPETLIVKNPLTPPPPPRIFYVQSGAFQSFVNAQKQQDKLIEQGYKTFIVQFDSDELGLHRLIFGEFHNEKNAVARAKKLKSGRVFELVNGRLYEL